MIFDWFNTMIFTRISSSFLRHILTLFGMSSETTNNDSQTPVYQRYDNIITLTLYYAWHVITRKIDVRYPDVQKKILNSEAVLRTIDRVARDQYRKHEKRKPMESSSSNNSDDLSNSHCDMNDVMLKSDIYRQSIQENRQLALNHLIRMSSCVSSSLLRIAGWILYRLLSKMFTTIHFNKQQINQIKKEKHKQQTEVPIIYLPSYRSHLDCILISFILSMNGLSPPLVAVNDNFLTPFFGNLMRGLGAFFVQRSSDDEEENEECSNNSDPIYQAILKSYIIQNLREGNSMEFFIEGRPSSTGKAMQPKLGLLRIVLDALIEGSLQQVQVVPVSISYEKLIEGPFVDERLENKIPMKQETFLSASTAIWSTLRSNYGTVRVDFGKPFMLNEYVNQFIVQQELQNHYRQHISHNDYDEDRFNGSVVKNIEFPAQSNTNNQCVACPLNRSAQTNSTNNSSKSYTGNTSGTGSTSNNKMQDSSKKRRGLEKIDELQRQQCIDSLARHVLHDAYQDSALMSTHLVSFILLNKYKKKGTTIDQLANDIDSLRQIICRTKQQNNCSISNDSFMAIRQATKFLGQDLICAEKVRLKWSSWNTNNNSTGYNQQQQQRWTNRATGNVNLSSRNKNGYNNGQASRMEIIYLKPANKQQSILHLHHYSNACATLFILESVSAMSLFSFVQTQFSSLIYDPSTFVSNLSINKQEYRKRCRTICEILQYEFIFNKSCQSLDQMLEKTFENSFVKQDVFVLNPNKPKGITLPMSDVNHHQQNLLRNRTFATKHSKRLNFKPAEGSLQNECILEVDENELRSSDEDSDHEQHKEFYIRLTEKNGQLLSLYRSILVPYMQSYWLVADQLRLMIPPSNCVDADDDVDDDSVDGNDQVKQSSANIMIKEESFLRTLVHRCKQMALTESIHYECTSIQTFKNALKYFEIIGAVKRRKLTKKTEVLNPFNMKALSSSITNVPSSLPVSTTFNTTHLTTTSSHDNHSQSSPLSANKSLTSTLAPPSTATFIECRFDKRKLSKLADSIKFFVK